MAFGEMHFIVRLLSLPSSRADVGPSMASGYVTDLAMVSTESFLVIGLLVNPPSLVMSSHKLKQAALQATARRSTQVVRKTSFTEQQCTPAPPAGEDATANCAQHGGHPSPPRLRRPRRPPQRRARKGRHLRGRRPGEGRLQLGAQTVGAPTGASIICVRTK